MKAYSYLRFSTVEQRLGNSTERQLKAARDYCQRNALELDEAASMADEGYSAYKGHHVEKGSLGHFLAEVKAGHIPTGTALVIENLDRLSRQGIDATTDLLKQLTQSGIEVHIISLNRVLKAGFNNSITDYVIIGVQADLAYQESLKKSERIGSSWKSKKARAIDGKALTTNAPLWLKAKPGEKVVAIPEHAATVKKIFQLAALGLGCTRIVRKLVEDGHRPFGQGGKKGRRWNLPYVGYILSSRTVLGEYQPHKLVNGKYVNDGDSIPGFYPAVIEYSEWEAARSVIDAKNTGRGKGYHGGGRQSDEVENLFSGMIKDKTANGRPINFYSKGSSSPALLVTAFDSKDKTVHRFPYQRFEKAFLGFLEELDWKAVAGESESSGLKNLNNQLSQISGEIENTSRLITNRTAQMDDADLDAATVKVFANQIAKAQDKLVQLSTQRDELSKTIESSRKSAEALYSPQELLNLIHQNDKEVRLRLKAEIRKRITRIDLRFDATILTSTGKEIEHVTPGKAKVLAKILFVNGIERMIVFRDDKAILLFLK
jgi:DNA invertase Pin-like site-specific DNA recombinase